MAFKLPIEVESPGQLLGCRFELERYGAWLRDSEARKTVKVGEVPEPSLTDTTLAVIRAWQGRKAVTPESLSELVEELTKIKVPILHLSLAALPSPALRATLVKWVRTNCQAEAL